MLSEDESQTADLGASDTTTARPAGPLVPSADSGGESSGRVVDGEHVGVDAIGTDVVGVANVTDAGVEAVPDDGAASGTGDVAPSVGVNEGASCDDGVATNGSEYVHASVDEGGAASQKDDVATGGSGDNAASENNLSLIHI